MDSSKNIDKLIEDFSYNLASCLIPQSDKKEYTTFICDLIGRLVDSYDFEEKVESKRDVSKHEFSDRINNYIDILNNERIKARKNGTFQPFVFQKKEEDEDDDDRFDDNDFF